MAAGVRRTDQVQINYNISREAKEILKEACGQQSKQYGHFLARLLHEWKARQEERMRVTAELQAAQPPAVR